MKHTPGPWHVKTHSRPYCIYVGPIGIDPTSGSKNPLGNVFRSRVCGPNEEQLANAKLIAAAPELLDALQALLFERYALEQPEQFDSNGNWTSNSPACVKAREVINKIFNE